LLIRKTGLFVRLVTRWGVRRRELSDIERNAYLAPHAARDSRLAQLRFVQDIPLQPDHPSHALVTQVQSKLEQFRATPTLICWGERDWVFDGHFLAEWQRILPQAEVHRFPEAGHLVLEDQPEEILPLVQKFMARHPVKE
jgi:haloalkane dehalogenase